MPTGSPEPKLVLTDEQARDLADRFGTPLYVFDESVFRQRIRSFQSAALAAGGPKTLLGFASKANSTLAVLRIANQEGCLIDVASEGELRAALAAGIPAKNTYLHGNNKSLDELKFALEVGVDHIVLDNLLEIQNLGRLNPKTPVALRLAPGVDPATHAKIRTGQFDTKFGIPALDLQFDEAVRAIKDQNLDLIGLHCHVGSQLMTGESQRQGAETLARYAQRLKTLHQIEIRLLNLGGGLGVSYLPGQEPHTFQTYNQSVLPAAREILDQVNPDAYLMQELGRALAADAGVTLYRVGPVKTTPAAHADKTYVVIDGGLADNPRPALYGAAYSMAVIPASPRPEAPTKNVTVSGRHCETDLLFPDVPLRQDVQPGDLLQVFTTGAYNSTMASNYNRYRRPATVLLRGQDQPSVLIQRPETWEEMIARESLPEDLI